MEIRRFRKRSRLSAALLCIPLLGCSAEARWEQESTAGRAAVQRGDYEAAIEHWSTALRARDALGGGADHRTREALRELDRAHVALARYQEALRIRERLWQTSLGNLASSHGYYQDLRDLVVEREGKDHPAAIHFRVETLERGARVPNIGLGEEEVRELEEIRRTCRDLGMITQDCAHALDLLAWAYGEMRGDGRGRRAKRDDVDRELARRYGTRDYVEAPW